MKFRRAARSEDTVNITPLIDVVFLLLIFFMVSTTFTEETELAVDLPEAEGEARENRDGKVEIVINAQGGYAVNGQALVDKSLQTLKGAIDEVSGGDDELPMVITADSGSPYQAVVTAMDAAQQTGFAHFSLTTREPETEE